MNAETAEHAKLLEGNKESYNISKDNFDPGAFAVLEGLAFNGRNTQS